MREIGKLFLAAAIGWVLTVVTLFTLNSFLDSRLKAGMSDFMESGNGSDSEGIRQRLEEDFLRLVAASSQENFIDTSGSAPAAKIGRAEILHLALQRTLLYGSPRIAQWRDATAAGLTAPYLEHLSVSPTVEELALALRAECLQIASAAAISAESNAPCEIAGAPEMKRPWVQRVAGDLGAAAKELQKLPAFQIRRWVNGGIQATTIWMMWSAIIFLVGFWLPAVRSELAVLLDPAPLARGRESPYECDQSARVFPSPRVTVRPDKQCIQFRDWLTGLHSTSRGQGSLDVLIQACNGFLKSRTVEAARQAAHARFEQLQEEVDSRFEAVRYLAWAIPSFGFIGTVLGIGSAMFDADAIVSAGTDRALQQSAIQRVTGQLGTAFDTTLVALVASLVLMAVYHACLRYGQVRIGEVHELVTDRLIGRMGGASLEQIFRLLVEKAMLDSKLHELVLAQQIIESQKSRLDQELASELEEQGSPAEVAEGGIGADGQGAA